MRRTSNREHDRHGPAVEATALVLAQARRVAAKARRMSEADLKWVFEVRAVLDQGARILDALKERLGVDDPAIPILDSWLQDYHALTDPDETFKPVLGDESA